MNEQEAKEIMKAVGIIKAEESKITKIEYGEEIFIHYVNHRGNNSILHIEWLDSNEGNRF